MKTASAATPECETLEPRWDGPIIVAATGESLTKQVAATCMASGCPIIAIKQAVIRLPTADVLYCCDSKHWDLPYPAFRAFAGERWSTHQQSIDNKLKAAEKHGLRLVRGERVKDGVFSTDPRRIHYGNSAGFQAIGFAIHWLKKPGRIVVVGLDMRGGYFYGFHPRWGRNPPPLGSYIPYFERSAKCLPDGVEIVLGTPSALRCFPTMALDKALELKAAA